MLLPVVADQGRAEGLGRGLAARVAVGRQGVRIALAGHESPEDAQARHARHVRDDVMELRSASDIERWALGTARVAVCDARSDDDLRSIADVWVTMADDVLLAASVDRMASPTSVPSGIPRQT